MFAYIFGSFVKSERFLDIDVAAFYDNEPDLLEIGGMQSELNKKTGKKVDIVTLNKLYEKKPAFAFNIITDGELIVNRNPQARTRYKTKVLLRYFDTAYLRKKVNRAFEKRIEMNKFDKRDFV